MKLCEMNCGLCLITVWGFFSSFFLFLLCLSFDYLCVFMLIIFSFRVEKEQYFKLDEFSFMRIICETPMREGKAFICSKASIKYKDVKSAS